MIATDLFTGKLVRLTIDEPAALGKTLARWNRNSTYMRLLDTDAPLLWSSKHIQTWFEKPEPNAYEFQIHTLQDDQHIGFIGLFLPEAMHRDAWVGIGIGEPDCWGKGYGTDAMRLMLRYGFLELNLHRVSLGVFSFNERAIRSYEKAGFVHEGRQRRMMRRDGEYGDILYMGVLRQEWMSRNG